MLLKNVLRDLVVFRSAKTIIENQKVTFFEYWSALIGLIFAVTMSGFVSVFLQKQFQNTEAADEQGLLSRMIAIYDEKSQVISDRLIEPLVVCYNFYIFHTHSGGYFSYTLYSNSSLYAIHLSVRIDVIKSIYTDVR